jgi:hypothetical protein
MSIALAQEAWDNFKRTGGMLADLYGIFPHPGLPNRPHNDLYIVIWSWTTPEMTDPYNVTSMQVAGAFGVQVGSSAYTLDLRGALAEVIERIGA